MFACPVELDTKNSISKRKMSLESKRNNYVWRFYNKIFLNFPFFCKFPFCLLDIFLDERRKIVKYDVTLILSMNFAFIPKLLQIFAEVLRCLNHALLEKVSSKSYPLWKVLKYVKVYPFLLSFPPVLPFLNYITIFLSFLKRLGTSRYDCNYYNIVAVYVW